MNDTKYSPATSKTEELMDGSFRSAMSYIALLVKLEAGSASAHLGNHFCCQLAFFTDQCQRSGVHLDVCACRSFAALDVCEESEDRIFLHGFYIFLV